MLISGFGFRSSRLGFVIDLPADFSLVENNCNAIDLVNSTTKNEISTPNWATRGLTSQSVFGRCCTTGHLGSTERSSSNNAGGWEGPSIYCWCFLLGTKCLWYPCFTSEKKHTQKGELCVGGFIVSDSLKRLVFPLI